MREPLFRAKRKDNGELVYGWYAPLVCNDKIVLPYIKDRNGSDYPVILETVKQFTGLKDKNGKEIFEGDSIAYSWNDLNKQRAIKKYIIGYDKDEAKTIAIPYKDASSYPLTTFKFINQRGEVIDNIYDDVAVLEKEIL